MNTIKIAVVEDEPIVAMDIVSQLQQSGYSIIGPFDSGDKLIKSTKTERPDLVLMDIKIAGELDGIETAEVLMSMIEVPLIFITASSDRQTIERAQKVRPHAYLIKPFGFHNLFSAINLALYNFACNVEEQKINQEEVIGSDAYPAYQTIFVRRTNSKRFEKLALENVILFEADGSYTKIINNGSPLTICCSLQRMLDKMKLKQFVRIHRSYAININLIQSVTEEEVTVGNINVPISETYKSNLFEQLNLL